tara:strand:+ start:806 stop:1351 length:546 start_codon:yes stop_codon:yes gene_type:complete
LIPLKVLKISYNPSNKNYSVILKEVDGQLCLPVIIGSFEAQSIALAIEVIETPRPLTHDLICDIFNTTNLDLDSVIIDRLDDGIFYSKIKISTKGSETFLIDARPSDSIAIAVRLDIPILISDDILNEAGVKENSNGNYKIKKISKTISLKSLKAKLKNAIDEEEYEKAAKLRDTISKLES